MRKLLRRRSIVHALVFLGYAGVAFAYFGARLLPHPGRVLVGSGTDPYIFVWSFAWWPHALQTGANPFVTHVLYAPQGINLAWTASAPGLALAFAPLTMLAGPVVAVNVATVLLPAFAAWTAYRLCLHVSRSVWASLIGGYLFGFSSFVLGEQLQAHLHLTSVFLIPLVALVAVRYVEGSLDGRGLAWRLGLLVAAQLSLSTEVALTLTIALVVGLALAWLLVPAVRGRVRTAVRPVAAAYVIAAVAAAPLLAYLAAGFRRSSFAGAENSSTDLANFLIPTHVNGLLGTSFGSVAQHYNDVEAAAYLGVPALIVIVLYAWRGRRSPGARFLVAALLLAAFVTLGDVLRVDGHRVTTLPWSAALHVPALDNVRPTRFAAYLALAGAVIVALWTASAVGRIYARPYLLPLLAVAALIPAVWHAGYYRTPVQRWPFFGREAPCLSGETVAAFPWSETGSYMLAQAESGFRFRLAGGYLLPPNKDAAPISSFDADPTVQELRFDGEVVPTMGRLLAFAAGHGVDRVLSDPAGGYPTASQLRAVGPVGRAGGLLVAPACGRPSLARRDLGAYVRLAAAQIAGDETTGWCLGPNYYALPDGFDPAGILAGAHHADFIEGQGLGCSPPPGYRRQGFAGTDLGVPLNTYPYYRAARPG